MRFDDIIKCSRDEESSIYGTDTNNPELPCSQLLLFLFRLQASSTMAGGITETGEPYSDYVSVTLSAVWL